MLITKEALGQYRPEIEKLYRQELAESPPTGLIYFGIFSGETLQAVAAVKNYMGTWYLRGCVVKPEFRGQGFQKALIEERMAYLSDKTDAVRVSVYPHNTHSIANIEATGFRFVKKKKLQDGHEVLIYSFDLK
jgi:ribosomal protein S18 acetylase RimI-like enzyme